MANPNPVISVATQFKPGHPGGPGRPRKRPQSEADDEMLRTVLPEIVRRKMNAIVIEDRRIEVEWLKPGATVADAISLGLAKKAMRGDPAAADSMANRAEGKPTQRFEGTVTSLGTQLVVIYGTPVPGEKQDAKQLPENVIDVEPVPAVDSGSLPLDGEKKHSPPKE